MKTPEFFPIGIGALSASTDCKIETIRYYERQGLLPEPPRSGDSIPSCPVIDALYQPLEDSLLATST